MFRFDALETDFALACGRTRVRFDGDPDRPAIVLIHGATVPHWEFDGLTPLLCRAGLRVVRYDLLGHGESARPRRRYGHELFVEQACSMFERAALEPRRTAVLGHSMGAAVAASLAARVGPAMLVLMAPMLDFSSANPFPRVLSIPGVGELFMATVGRQVLTRRRFRRYRAIGQPELARRFVEQGRTPGFWRALASMERNGALADQTRAYRSAAAAGIRPLIVHGTADAIIPTSDVDRIGALFAHHERVDLEGLEHNLMLTDPERVAAAISGHLAVSGLIDEVRPVVRPSSAA